MSNVKFNTAVESKAVDQLQIPIRDGQFIIVTDTHRLMYDDENNRIALGDVIDLNKESDRTAILAPINKFYFVKETGVLWRYNSGEWVKVADQTAVRVHTEKIVKSVDGVHGIRYNQDKNVIELYDSALEQWDAMESAGASVAVEATLRANGWSGGRQTVAVAGLTADQNGVVGLTQGISSAALEAARAGELHVCGQADNSLTISADGEIPKLDIPILIIMLG